MRKYGTEKELISETLRRLRLVPRTWWYKIPDPSRCTACGAIGLASIRPFDIIGCAHGNAIGIEIKRSMNLPLEKHQLAQLSLLARAGGFAVKMEGPGRFLDIDPYSATMTELCKTPEQLVDLAHF